MLILHHQRNVMKTTWGVLDPPVGNTRLSVVRLVASLLQSNTHSINTELINLNTLGVILVSMICILIIILYTRLHYYLYIYYKYLELNNNKMSCSLGNSLEIIQTRNTDNHIDSNSNSSDSSLETKCTSFLFYRWLIIQDLETAGIT